MIIIIENISVCTILHLKSLYLDNWFCILYRFLLLILLLLGWYTWTLSLRSTTLYTFLKFLLTKINKISYFISLFYKFINLKDSYLFMLPHLNLCGGYVLFYIDFPNWNTFPFHDSLSLSDRVTPFLYIYLTEIFLFIFLSYDLNLICFNN